jgi:hypothetical protein
VFSAGSNWNFNYFFPPIYIQGTRVLTGDWSGFGLFGHSVFWRRDGRILPMAVRNELVGPIRLACRMMDCPCLRCAYLSHPHTSGYLALLSIHYAKRTLLGYVTTGQPCRTPWLNTQQFHHSLCVILLYDINIATAAHYNSDLNENIKCLCNLFCKGIWYQISSKSVHDFSTWERMNIMTATNNSRFAYTNK